MKNKRKKKIKGEVLNNKSKDKNNKKKETGKEKEKGKRKKLNNMKKLRGKKKERTKNTNEPSLPDDLFETVLLEVS